MFINFTYVCVCHYVNKCCNDVEVRSGLDPLKLELQMLEPNAYLNH